MARSGRQKKSPSKAFSPDKPARSITELLEFLEADSPESYVFRGQVTHYPSLVTSSFRRWMIAGTEANEWIEVDQYAAIRSATDRENIRHDAKVILLNVFGRAIGNLLAQQYGLSSDGLDVSDDPRIAAFFATRTYPEYQHFAGDRERALGVIYRIPRWSDPPNEAAIDTTLSMIGMELEQPRGIAWFSRRLNVPGILFLRGQKELEEVLRKYSLDRDFAGANLATQAVRVTNQTLLRCYDAKCSELGLTVKLNGSRAMRQKGGMLFPSVVHECRIPARISLTPLERRNEYLAHPDTVAMLRAIAVGNTRYTRGLEAFFFRHGSAMINDFTPEDLWPGPETDEMLAILIAVLRDKLKRYLDDKGVDVLDFAEGIIDPGYR
jgi:hypothetical protein